MFFNLLGPRGGMGIGTDDLKKAYRQFPSAHPHLSGVVALYNPYTQDVNFFVLRGMAFGLKSSVLQFNRVSQFLQGVMRRLFASATCAYYDDFCVVEPPLIGKSSQFCLQNLANAVGVIFDKEKHATCATCNPFLGVVHDFVRYSSGFVTVRVKPERRDKLIHAIRHIIEHDKLTRHQAASLYGKLYFCCTTTFARIGVSALAAITVRQYQHSRYSKLTPSLLSALTFLLVLLLHMPPRLVSMKRPQKKPLLVWSDASLESGRGVLGFVSFDPIATKFYHSAIAVPAYIMSTFAANCINQLESLAALFCYMSLPEHMMRDRYMIHWADNTAALSGLYKTASPTADVSHILSLVAMIRLRLRFRPFYEYVRSKANVADLPSRLNFALLSNLQSTWLAPRLPSASEWCQPLYESLHALLDP